MQHVVGLIAAIAWLAGVVLASGAWLKVAAVCVPFYAWYLVVDRCMVLAGFLGGS